MTRLRLAAAARRAAFVLPLVGLAVGLTVAEPLVGAAPKADRGTFKTVTRTFARSAAIAIPEGGAANPYPATIDVSGLKQGRLKDVDLRLKNLSHGYGSDVDVLLVAPGGRNALVLSDVGSDADAADPPATLTLDDEAPPIPNLGDLPGGRFRPVNVSDGSIDTFPAPAPVPSAGVLLSTFDGIDPNGTWRLFVFDDVGSYGGHIAGGWALTIKARVGEDGKGNRKATGNGNGNGAGKGNGKGEGKDRGRHKHKSRTAGGRSAGRSPKPHPAVGVTAVRVGTEEDATWPA